MGKNGILAMGTDELYEVDGVVFDADSYARYLQHCKPAESPAERQAPPEPQQETAPPEEPHFPTFYAEPQHVGWYPSDSERTRVPMMSGALPPASGQEPPAPAYFLAPVYTVEEIRIPIGGQQLTRRIVYGGGSGSGSYATSFTTSFTTSYLTTYRFGSGSGSFFSSGSCIFAVGGYGLELI